MQNNRLQYLFTAKPWQYPGPAAWFFVSLPIKLSKEIRQNLGAEERGWGRLPVTAQCGNSEWKTAIWFDTKRNTYLLPLKAAIRKRENIMAGKRISVSLWI